MKPRRPAFAAAAVLLLAACGSEKADEPSGNGNGLLTAPYPVTVLDDGGGAELCLGGVADSYPPQCGGPGIPNWDWDQQDKGSFESANGVRWGDYVVVGTYDGETFTLESAQPGADWVPPDRSEEPDPFATPCPEPDGGWQVVDPASTTDASLQRSLRAAERLDGYAKAWVDQSLNDADPEASPEAMNDPAKLILNVRVTTDPAEAEAILRETWGGALCVSGGATYTDAELRRVQREMSDLPGILSSVPSDDGVEVMVVRDDGTLQAQVDQEYGEGVVTVHSALVPVEH